MSTTVTYKGQTLTTVENETKTLTTGGTWMEGDLTLTDVTQGGGGGITPTVKTVTIETAVTSGSNNSTALLESIEPELATPNANGVYTFYTFDFAGNTVASKGARFAAAIKLGSTTVYECYRLPSRWGGVMDFYVSAGTVVTVSKYDLYTFTE